MDDITIELDAVHIERLFASLAKLSGQFFLTSVQNLQVFSDQHPNQTIALPFTENSLTSIS